MPRSHDGEIGWRSAGSGLVNWSVCGDILARDLNTTHWRESIPGDKLRGLKWKRAQHFQKTAAGMAGTEEMRESDRRWLQGQRPDHSEPCRLWQGGGFHRNHLPKPILDPKGATVSISWTPEGDAHLGKNVLWGLKTQRIHLKIQRTEPFSRLSDGQCLEHGCQAQLLAELLQVKVAICKQHFTKASL